MAVKELFKKLGAVMALLAVATLPASAQVSQASAAASEASGIASSALAVASILTVKAGGQASMASAGWVVDALAFSVETSSMDL